MLHRRLNETFKALGLFVLAFGPRIIGLSAFITPDERRWIRRSVEFLSAIIKGDLSNTLQTGHPGVTTKWTGSIGLLIKYLSQTEQISLQGLNDFLARVPIRPTISLDYLAPSRLPTVVITSLFVVAVYLLARRLFGERVALLGAVLLALDPFFFAHSRFIHHDALVTTFMSLSVLCFLLHSRRPRQRTLLFLSGLTAGLAFLSKSSSFFLVPFTCLMCAAAYLSQSGLKLDTVRLKLWAGTFVIWLIVAASTFFLLWPSLWVNPSGTMSMVFGRALKYAGKPHSSGNYFMGRPVGDPGPLFYPLSLVFRSTPLSLVGLAMVIGLMAGQLRARRWRRLLEENGTTFSLLAYIFLFAAFMTFGKKKFDRYLLPVFPAMDLLAAMGWYRVIVGRLSRPQLWFVVRALALLKGAKAPTTNRCCGVLRPKVKHVWALSLVGALLIQAGFCLPHHPYYLTFYNPLAGGIKTARRVILVGWGEGLDRVARYLNSKENVSELKVASWYERELRPFFLGSARPLVKEGTGLMPWQTADYVVFYINQVLREVPDPEMVRFFRGQEPEHVVRLAGIEYAWVYQGLKLPKMQYYVDMKIGERKLLGYDLPTLSIKPGEEIRATLYWECEGEGGGEGVAELKLIDDSGRAWGDEQNPKLFSFSCRKGTAIRDEHTLALGSDIPSGRYTLAVNLKDVEGKPLGEVSFSHIWVKNFQVPPSVEEEVKANFEGKVELIGYSLEPEELFPGKTLKITLFWRCLAEMKESYKAFAHLLDRIWRKWGQRDSIPAGGTYPTTWWTKGEVIVDEYEIEVHPDAPAGKYWIWVGMYDEMEGRRLSVLDGRGKPIDDKVMLGPLKVVRPFEVASISYPLLARFGEKISFLGYDLDREAIKRGETLHLALYWRAEGGIAKDYTVFVHLLDKRGRLWAQSDSEPGGGCNPTSFWDAGEMVKDEHELAIGRNVPPGEYRLEIGMYEWMSGERLPVYLNGRRLLQDSLLLESSIVVE